MKSIFYIYISLVTVAALAAPKASDSPIVFKSWKEQQLIEARNNVVRMANKITLFRAGKVSEQEIIQELSANNIDAESTSVQKANSQKPIERLENELRVAQENLQIAQELTVEDYFIVYLSQFRSKPDAIQSVASRMSKDEVAELIRAMLNRGAAATSAGGGAPAVKAGTPTSAL